MPSLNKTMIIGNLGADPELRYTPGGNAVVEFRVAVNRSYKDQQGEWQDETTWFRAKAWGDRAERIAEQFKKGTLVYVEGRTHGFSYPHKTYSDVTVYGQEIIVERSFTLEKRNGERSGDAYVDEQARPAEQREESPAIDVDDIPF